MGHDNHDDHHHVDDLSGFSLFRLIWPAALLFLLIFVTRNCCSYDNCCGDKCEKPGAKTEMHDEHGGHGHEEGVHH
ncbi:MAG TPA: hypothetical protein VD905_11440 [Flavobacteriales bacterium]|nr:hypothetical protein [Flavobacteriales bacterium]